MNTLENLVEDLAYRQRFLEGRNSAAFLKEVDARFLIEFTYPHILQGLERKSSLTDIIANMGSRIRQKLKLERDSIKAVQAGWYVLISYFELDILGYYCKHLKVKNKRSKYPTYQLKVKDWESLQNMITIVDTEVSDLFPTKDPSSSWSGSEMLHDETGKPLIRNAHKDALLAIEKTDLSYLVETLNKLNNTGWRINQNIFEIYQKCMHLEKTPFKFAKEVDPQKKASLLIETEAIGKLAGRNLNNTFYHLYNVDFRGRIYPNTAYLHEQSSDNAKGLLLLDEATPLGENGFYWLCVHTANMWGNDKVPLDERALWTTENFDKLMSYVENFHQNNTWMEAEKPWCFLACCHELSLISNWCEDGNDQETFPSCLPVYIDGSNNGVQHLAAMSKDSEVAPLVNLVPSKIPGDVYMFIADKVWETIADLSDDLGKEGHSEFQKLYAEIIRLKRETEKWPQGTEKNKLAYQALREFKNHNYDLSRKLWPIFWNAIQDRKIQRKCVKRNVMTLGYGGTKFGMGEQVNEDTRSINDYLRDKEEAWGVKLGHLVYDTCYAELDGPARLLKMFKQLAERENEKERPITYYTPITNFPFVHKYRKAASKRARLKYGDDELQIQIQVWEDSSLDYSKQKSGAAPNIVHSLDAVHLAMTVHDADYPVTVVHDSFGCTAGNMNHMFVHVRQKFVELYDLNPLEYVLDQMDSLDLIPKKGDLDVSEVLKSDFAFA